MKSNRFVFIYFIVAVLGCITSFYFYFASGRPIDVYVFTPIMGWVLCGATAIITLRGYNIFYKGRDANAYLRLLLFVPPIIDTISRVIVNKWGNYNNELNVILNYTSFLLLCTFLCFSAYKLSSSKIRGLRISNETILSEDTSHLSATAESLGKGNTNLDVVIRSLFERAAAAQKMSNLSLVLMIFIVFIGGGASIGTTALDELKKVREIEIERNDLLSLNRKLADITKKGKFDKHRDSMINVVAVLLQNQYGKEKDYEIVLQKIEKRAQNITTGWQDLAMKISIAVLSLFLVQVFFHIYKFNQQQYSYLLARAEALQLFKDTPDQDLKEMRNAVLAKMEVSPRFGKNPQSAIELALELINKGKGA